jgi:hypothetical protein
MKMDDLDRILMSEKPVTPSPSFSVDTMLRVQAEASPGFHVSFPWLPFMLSLTILVILSAFFFNIDPALRAMNHMVSVMSAWIVTPKDPVLKNAALLACASLLGTLMLLWLSFQLTDAR